MAVEADGRIVLSKGVTDQRNASLCDIFFGISAMERAGTGLMDVGQLMLTSGGGSAFYDSPVESRFTAVVAQPQASAGSRTIARSDVPTGLYVLNVLPFTAMPGRITMKGITIFGKAAISGVRRAADIDFAAMARWTTKKSVHQ